MAFNETGTPRNIKKERKDHENDGYILGYEGSVVFAVKPVTSQGREI